MIGINWKWKSLLLSSVQGSCISIKPGHTKQKAFSPEPARWNASWPGLHGGGVSPSTSATAHGKQVGGSWHSNPPWTWMGRVLDAGMTMGGALIHSGCGAQAAVYLIVCPCLPEVVKDQRRVSDKEMGPGSRDHGDGPCHRLSCRIIVNIMSLIL